MAPTTLRAYQEKRDFQKTPEPRGKPHAQAGFSYVIQKHAARRLHYDFRLELDGVLLSWAVPKGPSLDPKVKRLAVQTEDHPVEYGSFEGIIPKGEYGGGTVMLWDQGTWEPEGDPRQDYRKGRLSFTLHGKRLKGKWHLVRTRGAKDSGQNWLLFKGSDRSAVGDGESLVETADRSVATHRTMPEIAEDDRSSIHSSKSRKHRPKGSVLAPRSVSAAARPDLATASRSPRAPAILEVQKATLSRDVPEGEEWLHEIKLDGYRVLAHLEKPDVQLMTRSGKDFGSKTPALARELSELASKGTVLDGEIVVLRDDGVSDFQRLQNALGATTRGEILYCAFDLLFLEGRDLRDRPLRERKQLLKDLLSRGPELAHVRLSDHVIGSGPKFFTSACEAGLEGIVSKRIDAPYRAGRSLEWLKIKCSARQEFVIGGFSEPSGSRSHLGAILIGVWKDRELAYSGKVGTGFTEASLAELHGQLSGLERKKSPFVNPPRGAESRGVHWVSPQLVAEIEFTEFTNDGRLRHPVFRGLRQDKPAREVVREHSLPSPPSRRATKKRSPNRATPSSAPELPALPAGFSLTHSDRVLYPEQGITKQQLAEYTVLVAPYMLPHVSERPLTLVRCPGGQQKACFFQKHAQKGQPQEIRLFSNGESDGAADFMFIRDLEGLLALCQMGVLEIHTWGSHVRNLEKPDLLVFDLDPDPSVSWERVVEGARLIRSLFERLELESFVKTTGGKGLHVCVPIRPRLEWDDVKEFCRSLAESLVLHAPDRYVATVSKAKRRGKIFVDYLRNGRGATFIAPYSTRARPGAPVAVPVSWQELDRVRSDSFTLETLPKRLAALTGDPWQRISELKQTLSLSRIRSLTAAELAPKKG